MAGVPWLTKTSLWTGREGRGGHVWLGPPDLTVFPGQWELQNVRNFWKWECGNARDVSNLPVVWCCYKERGAGLTWSRSKWKVWGSLPGHSWVKEASRRVEANGNVSISSYYRGLVICLWLSRVLCRYVGLGQAVNIGYQDKLILYLQILILYDCVKLN